MITENEKDKRFIAAIPLILIFIFLIGYIAGGLTVKKMHQDQENIQKEETRMSQQLDTLDEWATLQMAIVMTESRFNPEAVGAAGDWGIFQQIPIYVEDCNRILKLRQSEERYCHEDSFDIGKSIEMFNLLQSHYNPSLDIEQAIHYQNKASWYRKKVYENIVFIQRMEEVRKQLKSRS